MQGYPLNPDRDNSKPELLKRGLASPSTRKTGEPKPAFLEKTVQKKELRRIRDKGGRAGSQESFKSKKVNRGTEYLEKEITPAEVLQEKLGSDMYRFYGTSVPKTLIVQSPSSDKTTLGSKWGKDYEDFGEHSYLRPYISEGEVMAVDPTNGLSQPIEGYFSMVITGKFIADFDVLGAGANAGVIPRDFKSPRLRKIDPGAAFDFEHDDQAFLTKMDEEAPEISYASYVPLKYEGELANPKDLLVGEMSYNQIKKHPKLYREYCLAILDITITTDAELEFLIMGGGKREIPDKIDGISLTTKKQFVLESLKKRREVLKKIYAKEIAYAEQVILAKKEGVDIPPPPYLLENLATLYGNEDITASEALARAAEDGNIMLAIQILAEHEDLSPEAVGRALYSAAFSQHENSAEIIDIIMSSGFQIHPACANLALQYAVANGQTSKVRAILEAKMPEYSNVMYDESLNAAKFQRLACLQLLLDKAKDKDLARKVIFELFKTNDLEAIKTVLKTTQGKEALINIREEFIKEALRNGRLKAARLFTKSLTISQAINTKMISNPIIGSIQITV